MTAQSLTGTDLATPATLESPRAKLVYVYLRANDGASIDTLCTDLQVKKGTALSITRTLCNRGHIERTEDGFTSV